MPVVYMLHLRFITKMTFASHCMPLSKPILRREGTGYPKSLVDFAGALELHERASLKITTLDP